MEIKVLFHTSKRIAAKFDAIKFGKYTIEPIPVPADVTATTSATNKYLLRFEDEIRAEDGRSHPEQEARFVLSYLSVVLGTPLEFEALMLNSVNAPIAVREFGKDELIEDLPQIEALYQKLRLSESDFARQFLRACEVYRTAINIYNTNNTLSYFLLTVSVECLSNIYGGGEGKCDKFIDFILKNLPEKLDLSDEDWKELLKEIYYRHRSGFTHGGKEIPEAVSMADSLNRVYVRNIIDGKEIRSPGLKWFAKIVRSVLINYLDHIPDGPSETHDALKDLSLKYGEVTLKASRAIVANSAVTDQDFILD